MESDATRRMRFFKVSKKPFMEMKPESIFNLQMNNSGSMDSGKDKEIPVVAV